MDLFKFQECCHYEVISGLLDPVTLLLTFDCSNQARGLKICCDFILFQVDISFGRDICGDTVIKMENRPFITGEGGPNKRSPRSLNTHKELPEEVRENPNKRYNIDLHVFKEVRVKEAILQIWS